MRSGGGRSSFRTATADELQEELGFANSSLSVDKTSVNSNSSSFSKTPLRSSVSRRSVLGVPGRSSVSAKIRRLSAMIAPTATSTAAATPKPPPKASAMLFRNCDANRDDLLSRSEFTNALQMIVYAEGDNSWFDDLTVDDLDQEFSLALGGVSEDDMLGPDQFDKWLLGFRNGFLRQMG